MLIELLPLIYSVIMDISCLIPYICFQSLCFHGGIPLLPEVLSVVCFLRLSFELINFSPANFSWFVVKVSESARVSALMMAPMVLTSLLSDLSAFSLGSQSSSLRDMYWTAPISSINSSISSLNSVIFQVTHFLEGVVALVVLLILLFQTVQV